MKIFATYKENLFLNLFLVYILWGSTYLGVKIGLKDLSPLFLTSLRFTVGGIILFVITSFAKGLPKLEEAKGSILIGGILTGIGTTSIAFSIKYIPSGIVAMLVALLPLWTFILDFFFFTKNKPTGYSLAGLALGLVGVLFLFNPFGVKGELNSEMLFPIIIIFIGSISWAFGSIISPSIRQSSGMHGVSIQMLSGGLLALTISLIFERNHLNQLVNMHQESVLAMAYLIFVGSFIGYTAFIWLINNAPPILTSSYAYVNPVVAMILAYFFANEKLSTVSIVASAIILTGVVFMTIGRKKSKEKL